MGKDEAVSGCFRKEATKGIRIPISLKGGERALMAQEATEVLQRPIPLVPDFEEATISWSSPSPSSSEWGN